MAATRQHGLVLAFFAACLVATALAQQDLPEFSSTGGPPFVDGVYYGYSTAPDDAVPQGSVSRTGVQSKGRFTITKYTGDGPLTYMGEYVSWECVDPENSPGEYYAIVILQMMQPDPNSASLLVVQQPVCEYGVVSPGENSLRLTWGQDPTQCPNVTTRVMYRDWAPPGLNYTCGVPDTGNSDSGLDLGGTGVTPDESGLGGGGPTEMVDTDGDGDVNAVDRDDDNDGIPDSRDPTPDRAGAGAAPGPAPQLGGNGGASTR